MRNCHGNVMSEAMALCNETPVILVNKVDQNWKGGGHKGLLSSYSHELQRQHCKNVQRD
jgi:hypothetical protein